MISLINVDERASRRERELLQIIAQQQSRIGEREKRIAGLEEELAKARKNSSNSSKPPSSDNVKPPKRPPPEGEGERKKGGQPGHPQHDRPPFTPDQVNKSHESPLEECPDCGGGLEPSDAAPRVVQQVEIVEIPIKIEEHRGEAHGCPRCRRIH